MADQADHDKVREDGEKVEEGFTRRKLVYAAPMLLSKRIFYRAITCNKNPQTFGGCIHTGTRDS